MRIYRRNINKKLYFKMLIILIIYNLKCYVLIILEFFKRENKFLVEKNSYVR